MPDRLPSLNALRVFEAAARHLSFSRAAEELHLTQSAVSHQIRALEIELGVRLFHRAGRSMLLTGHGQRLCVHVREGLACFARGVAELRDERGPQTLTISVVPSLAASWLVPRLPDFYLRNPGIDVTIHATTEFASFIRDNIDLALRTGHGNWPGLRSELLLATDVFPVCSPAYRGGNLPKTPADLLDCALLHAFPVASWEEWFKSAGITLNGPLRGPRFSDPGMAVETARNAQGVTLGREAFVREYLENGQLVRLMQDLPGLRTSSYYIVYPEGAELSRGTRLFHDWLLEQARHSD
ncbi:MAG TPA: transcriptional regulator GcvA [Acidiphilium sp.]